MPIMRTLEHTCHMIVMWRRIHLTLQPICNSRCHTTTADTSAGSSGLNSPTLSENARLPTRHPTARRSGQKRVSHLPGPITFSPDIKSGKKSGIVWCRLKAHYIWCTHPHCSRLDHTDRADCVGQLLDEDDWYRIGPTIGKRERDSEANYIRCTGLNCSWLASDINILISVASWHKRSMASNQNCLTAEVLIIFFHGAQDCCLKTRFIWN